MINRYGELMKICCSILKDRLTKIDNTDRPTEIIKTWYMEMKGEYSEIDVVISDLMTHLLVF